MLTSDVRFERLLCGNKSVQRKRGLKCKMVKNLDILRPHRRKNINIALRGRTSGNDEKYRTGTGNVRHYSHWTAVLAEIRLATLSTIALGERTSGIGEKHRPGNMQHNRTRRLAERKFSGN